MTVYCVLRDTVARALGEDLAGGDLSSEATIPRSSWAQATAIAKQELVLSGGEVFSLCFHEVDPACRVERRVEDGACVQPGTILFLVEGPARALLMAERTALNFLQRLSGTATLTREFVTAAAGRCRITDTRKTTPGLRALEKQAVRDGGGHSHRVDLGAAVMIKDNHISAASGIKAAVARAREYAPHTSRIEVEVTNQAELEEALEAQADIVMLDNMNDAQIEAAVRFVARRAIVEVSGNMNLERVSRLAGSGVDVISVGALTHSAQAADISLRLSPLDLESSIPAE